MDENVLKKLQEKFRETMGHEDELRQLIKSLSSVDDSVSFALGIVVGRLYNTFYYQSKRMLDREPTRSEFEEFLKFIENKKSALKDLR